MKTILTLALLTGFCAQASIQNSDTNEANLFIGPLNGAVTGSVTTTNLAISGTVTNVLVSSGYTNKNNFNQTVYFAGTSVTMKDNNGVQLFSFGTISTSDTCVLHPSWAINGTGMSGLAVK
jgi:hypothetical protein